MPMMFPIQTKMFQSTYLYKVRQKITLIGVQQLEFQSTYLYKVRQTHPYSIVTHRQVSIHVPI